MSFKKDVEKFRAQYVENLEEIIAQLQKIRDKIKEGGFTTNQDWSPIADLFSYPVTYIDESGNQQEEVLDSMFQISEDSYN